jgi:hypothetical protein
MAAMLKSEILWGPGNFLPSAEEQKVKLAIYRRISYTFTVGLSMPWRAHHYRVISEFFTFLPATLNLSLTLPASAFS